MSIDDRTKLAFDTVRDSFKQLTTLGTSALGLESAFLSFYGIGKAAEVSLTAWQLWTLFASVLCFAFSVAFGVWGAFAVTGTVAQSTHTFDQTIIYRSNITFPAFTQIISFILGVLFTVIFIGLVSCGSQADKRPESTKTVKEKTNINVDKKPGPSVVEPKKPTIVNKESH